jgi:hypothetical protein
MLNKKMKLIISRLEKLKHRSINPAIERLENRNINQLLKLDDENFIKHCKTWGLISRKKLIIEPIIKKEKSITLQAIRQRKFRKKLKEKNIKVLSIKIEDETKKKFKLYCSREGKTMDKKINQFIEEYLKRGIGNQMF